jgi:hypothetical protein
MPSPSIGARLRGLLSVAFIAVAFIGARVERST